MTLIREVVLDAATGLPEVVVSISSEGHLTFRSSQVHPGGMNVLVPISDAVLKSMLEEYASPDGVGWDAGKIEAVQAAYAKSIQDADESRLQRVEELTADVEALGKVINDERARADAAILRAEEAERTLGALRGHEAQGGVEPERKPVGRPRRNPAPA